MHDVAIVGAGYAGLAVAHALHQAGADVVVLEARDRVGGRVWTDHRDGGPLERGGQWVNADHRRLDAAVTAEGLEFAAIEPRGSGIILDRGRPLDDSAVSARLLSGSLPMLPAIARLDRLSRRPGSASRSTQSVETWLRRWVLPKRSRAWLRTSMLGAMAIEPKDLGLAGLVAGIPGGSLLHALVAETTGQRLMIDGADGLARQWARRLPDVRLGAPVVAVDREGVGYRVRTASTSVRSRAVVVAVPTALALDIRFDPDLPDRTRHAARAIAMGSVTKTVLEFREPHWRNEGRSGSAMDPELGLVVADASLPDGQPRLAVLAAGRAATTSLEVILARMTLMFGNAVGHPDAVISTAWGRELWTRGGYGGLPGVGAPPDADETIRSRVDGIHFAGVETAREYHGYIEGALESAERVVGELAD